MKKSKVTQATLFQSWGHSAQASSSRNPNFCGWETNIRQPQNTVDPNDIIDLGDEEDDDELIAAAEEIAQLDEGNFQTVRGQSNATTNISCHAEETEVIPGFDLEAGNVWIYPTNYPVRNYQYDIVEKALYRNTLVTLPTGLGKTFIAAVVMYNFYRWYPQGKVIFMAPTKPLVAQQIEACFNIMGIPQSDTVEMTGNMAPNKRQSLWQSRRVFFLTPQVLQNDLNRGSCKAEDVVLLVADEAHKALGNHAYCQVVREISGYTRNFRVLALSATPGDDLEAVQQVITNLLISHMELRSEESPDIKPYTHTRQVEQVVVPLGEDIGKIKASYLKVLEVVVSRLFCQRALWQRDPQRVTKALLLSARDQFRKKMNEQGGLDRNQQSRIEGDFAMCISLYHAYELLLQHGILSFYNFIKGIMDGTKGMARAKTEITKNYEFSQLMDELREEIEPPMESGANDSLLFSQFSPRRRALMNVPKPSSTFKSHPKLMKLKEIVLEHFEKFKDKSGADASGVATRVMIFSQYRDSVNEIAAMLAKHKPLVRVMSFIGQQSTGKSSRGLTQKEQLQVVQRFRQGGYNTLVATCVGEEGLDIGEVDLIVCFDAHASPIRLVQRMGRTGRKRDGRIVILVTEGKEEQVYKKSQRNKKSIHKAVTQAAKSFDLYTENPRMVPRQLTPSVLKMEMTVGKFQAQSKGKKKGRPSDGANIKDYTSKSKTTTVKKSDGFLTYEELVYWQEHFKLPDHEAGLSPQLSVTKRSRRSLSEAKKPDAQASLSDWLPWQTTLHPVKAVMHSRRTEHLVELLEFTELHGARGDENESYDLEMMSFLNEEDILKPGETQSDDAEVRARENVDDCEESEGASKIGKKGKKTRKKLKMGEDEAEAKDGGQNSSKEDGAGGTAAKKNNTKGAKRRSPENKARWKEFLKQFENKDEDFESDDGNATAESKENMAVENDLRTRDEEDLEIDLPDVGEVLEDVNTKEVDSDETRPQEEVLQSCNNESIPLKETERVPVSGCGESSDAATDEFSNLFPNATPDFHVFNSGFKPQQTRFASVASVPTPPSVDALDKISLSPASVEHDEFSMETEVKVQKEPRTNPPSKEEKSVALGKAFPKPCFESDAFVEPFLMADFLEEDDEAKSDIEPGEGSTLKSGRLENDVRNTSTCKTSLEICVDSSAKIHVNEATHKEIRDPQSPLGENLSSEDNVNGFEKNIRGTQTSREVAKESSSRGFTKVHDAWGTSKDADSKAGNIEAVAQNDFGFGVVCGSPVKVLNDDEEEEDGFPQEDPVFAEAFFMDVTDDDAFTNMTLPGGDTDTEGDRLKRAADGELVSEGEKGKRTPCEVKGSEVIGTESESENSKTASKSKATRENFHGEKSKTSVGIDLRTSISKLSAFKRSSTDRVTSSTLAGSLNRDSESESRKNTCTLPEEVKQCLAEEALSMEASQILHGHEVRTRGEHTSAIALRSDTDIPDRMRNSVAVLPGSATISPRETSSKLSVKEKQRSVASRDRFCPDKNQEVPEKSYLTKVRNKAREENPRNNAGSNVGGIIGDNVGNDERNSVSKSISSTNNSASDTGSNDVHNVCRSPLPKKFKLSRKRTSETKTQDISVPANQAKPNSLNPNPGEDNSCDVNIDGPREKVSSRNIECRDSKMSLREPVSTVTAPKDSSGDREDRSADLSHLRTHNGAVVAVMESDDEEDDEDVIRPVRKAISLRRQALSSPCSQEGFKKPVSPGKHRYNETYRASSRDVRLGSESDEEFEVHKSAVQNRPQPVKHAQDKPSAQKRKSLEICTKRGTRKSLDCLRKKNNRPRKSHFLDDEAELSGSDIGDFSDNEGEEDDDEDEMDSFIDDCTQLTQRTPSTSKPRHASSPVDMMAVYRQSLRSPLCGALNFRTPLFHKQRNKYKMVYKYRNVDEDGESTSEAEETYESENAFENEVEEEDENEAETRYDNEVIAGYGNEVSRGPGGENAQMSHLHAEKSFEESQIGRPVKRMKRKRILDDSLDQEVSPKLSKHRNLSETSNKENTFDTNMVVPTLNSNTQILASEQRKTIASGNFPTKSSTITGNNLHGDFVKSSVVLVNKSHFHDNDSEVLGRSAANRESMRKSGSFPADWNNDISDSELLVAFEGDSVNETSVKKPTPSKIFQDKDLKEIAVAMEMTDDDVAMEINELPTFSLGFDFLSESIFTNDASPGERKCNSSKDNLTTFTARESENYGIKASCAIPQDSFISTKNATEFPSRRSSSRQCSDSHGTENFTKIAQGPKQSLERSHQVTNNSQVQSKTGAEGVSRPVSNPRTVAPQKTMKPNISNSSSFASDQRVVSNNSLPSAAQTKTTAQNGGQSSASNAHSKLQVVTPSCRSNPLVTRPAMSPLLSSWQKDKGKTVILVDTREISSSQVVSLLRLKHNIKAEVCQLTSCDYIVSNRMAVKRKSASDVANGANSPKLVECMRRMCDLYDRPCLIIEKDRVKPGETDKNFIKTKAYILTLASMAQTHVKMVFSDSQEETATLLTELANIETKKGMAITAPTALSKEREQVFRVLVSIPRVSYVTALNLCISYKTLHEIVNSTPAELERRTPGLSGTRAAEIYKYLRHKFNPEMVPAKK